MLYNIKLRKRQFVICEEENATSDCELLAILFFQTVHGVNTNDYAKEQLDVWATGNVDLEEWNKSFLKHHTIVAIENNEIVGFKDRLHCVGGLFSCSDIFDFQFSFLGESTLQRTWSSVSVHLLVLIDCSSNGQVIVSLCCIHHRKDINDISVLSKQPPPVTTII